VQPPRAGDIAQLTSDGTTVTALSEPLTSFIPRVDVPAIRLAVARDLGGERLAG
jgi:hypothetical protein